MNARTLEPSPLTLDTEKLRAVIYGEFGRGKTTLAGTFPRPLIIDTNGGLVSLALQGVKAETFAPTGHEDLEALYRWVEAHSDKYDSIVIDTLDSLVYALMGEITDDAVAGKRRKGELVSLRMQYVPEQGDYFASQRQMFGFLNALRRLGKHVAVTSSMKDALGHTRPNVSAGMEKVVCDWASIIGELIILDLDPKHGQPEKDALGTAPYDGCRVLLTGENNRRATKSRFASIKPYVVDPTFDKLALAIEAEFNRKDK